MGVPAGDLHGEIFHCLSISSRYLCSALKLFLRYGVYWTAWWLGIRFEVNRMVESIARWEFFRRRRTE